MTASLRLPIFPLGLVLYPGVQLPLHLFEPRYRQMLADVQHGERQFGIVSAMPGVPERELPAGRAGCVAQLGQVEMMPDGRANIVVVGTTPFTLDRFVDDDAPYHVADVTPFGDVADVPPVALAVAADDVAARFQQVVTAVRTANASDDADKDDDGSPPALPDDPALLAFAIASMIDLPLDHRQAILGERRPSQRLSSVDAVLRRVLPDLELQAAMRKRS